MIDLTKPIRRKDKKDNKTWRVLELKPYYSMISDSGDGCHALFMDIERDYENIPEPRRPREWRALEHSIDCEMVYAYRPPLPFNTEGEQLVRMIEWPENAPLPEWPEGY